MLSTSTLLGRDSWGTEEEKSSGKWRNDDIHFGPNWGRCEAQTKEMKQSKPDLLIQGPGPP